MNIFVCIPKNSGEPKLDAKCVICKPAAAWCWNKAAGGSERVGLIESFLEKRLSLIGELDGDLSAMPRDCFDKMLSIVKRDVLEEEVPFLHIFSLFLWSL